MNRLLALSALLLLLASCGNSKKIKLAEVDSLFIEYDSDSPNNYGTPFDAVIGARMKTGETRYLKNNSDFVCSDNVVCLVSDKQITVVSVPGSYDANKIPVTLAMGNRQGDTVRSLDTLRLNFRSGITLSGVHHDGKNGADGKSKSTPLLFRDGNAGENGLMGENGANGDSYDIHIWRDSVGYCIHVLNLNSGLKGSYRIIGSRPFALNVSGARGGDGGTGGKGGDGKDGVTGDKDKRPGDAGNGGSGGGGGNGGNGGTIRCIVHPNAMAIRPQLQFVSEAGAPGKGGKGGNEGTPGKAMPGQNAARQGFKGANGWNGGFGSRGLISILEEAFDPETYR